jgi:MFS family permease
MFLCIGAPGIVLGLLAARVIREPRLDKTRAGNPDSSVSVDSRKSESPASLLHVTKVLWRNVTFRHLLLAFAVYYFFACGITQWTPAFFIRSFGMRTGELGTWFAIIQSVCGLIGTFCGGAWASRYAGNNEALQLKAMAIANGSFNAGVWALIYTSHTSATALVWMGLSTLGGTTILGPMSALAQTLVPSHMRASAVAIIYLFANLIGLGLGPLAVGALSDLMHGHLGNESLRYALLITSPGYLWVSWHFWKASRTVGRDLATLNELDPAKPVVPLPI